MADWGWAVLDLRTRMGRLERKNEEQERRIRNLESALAKLSRDMNEIGSKNE